MNWNSKQVFLTAFLMVISSLILAGDRKLISAEELNKWTADENMVLLDISPPEKFQAGHIPGARQVWRPDFTDTTAAYDGMMASRDQMEKLLGSKGVNPGNMLILYDNRAGCEAARLWWILDYYGYHNVFLLNGGLKAWRQKGFPVTTEDTPVKPVEFYFNTATDRRYYASIEDVKKAIDDPGVIIIDTRSEEEFIGKEQRKNAYRSGRIPTSIHLDWGMSVDMNKDDSFIHPDLIRKLYNEIGAWPEKNIILYCQSGTRSAHATFVLTQLLGYKNVKNYDGSWIEWSYFDELPVESGPVAKEDPATLREKKNYLEIARSGYTNYAQYLWHEITHPGWHNYFYWLLIVSAFFFIIELLFPWRKKQAAFRKDFWLDFFYMFFNFFLFSLVVYNAASDVVVNFFNDALASIGIPNLVAFEVQTWPIWAHLLLGFVVRDFVQWWIHRLLHRVPFLWEFHKVHHSVEEMGFAAHLRFHWMENIVYRTIEYIPLALIGIGLNDFFIIHIFALTIGHWNHSNFRMNIGPLKYIFNNPQMHIWHHAHDLPRNKPYGVNFGLTLSIWDYLFRTNYIPYDGRDIKLGFPGIEKFPRKFWGQAFYGLKLRSKKKEN